MLSIGRLRTIAPDTNRKLGTELVLPETDVLQTDDGASLCQKTFDIRCAKCKPMIRPHCVGETSWGEGKPFRRGIEMVSSVIVTRYP